MVQETAVEASCELCGESPSEMEFHTIAQQGMFKADICMTCFDAAPSDGALARKILSRRQVQVEKIFSISVTPGSPVPDELYDSVLRFLLTGEHETEEGHDKT